MDESFALPVTYKGEEMEFQARVLAFGYSYKIEVEVNDVAIVFELDDSREFRAVLANPEADMGKRPDKGLIEAIARTLESLIK